ncbi:MAG: hypothetical protein ACOCXG_03865 [Nanoarchaeota archaeon]
MEFKLKNTKQRKEMIEIYSKLFNLIDSNSKDKKLINNLIQMFEEFGIKRTKIGYNKKSTVCANFVIEVINELTGRNIPITRSFETYGEYIKLLSKKQKEELTKIENKLNLNEKSKKEIYGIHILKEILDFYPFREVEKIIPNSIIVYFGDTYGKDLPEHMGFLLDNGQVISKFGVIPEIFLHPIEGIPLGWGERYKIYEFDFKDFKKTLSKFFN